MDCENTHEFGSQVDLTNSTEYGAIKNLGFNLNYEFNDYLLKDFEPTDDHTILFDHNSIKCNDHVGPPSPLHLKYIDKWNDEYVKMPFSDFNLNEKNQSQWPATINFLNMLSKTLVEDPDSIHIEYAIKKINAKIGGNKWKFNAIHHLFNKELEASESERILKETIPSMIKLALELPNKIGKAIPILRAGMNHSITLSQEQCACLLANAFFLHISRTMF